MAFFADSRALRGSRTASVDDSTGPPREADGVYAQLLEQAGDLNDELCRENCELRSEVSLLRQRQLRRMQKGVQAAQPAVPPRAAKARALLPHAMSNVKSALRDFPLPDIPGAEGIAPAVEEAIHGVLAAVAELGPSAALASDKETEALISEKVALKEFCIRQQERLVELELAKEKASHSGNWALRMIQGTLADSGAVGPPAAGEAVEAPPPTVALAVAAGQECEVVGRKGAILRETEDLQSALVATVPPGGHVRILQVGATARRALAEVVAAEEAQIPEGWSAVAPGAAGWLSVSTKDGKALLRPLPTKQSEDGERLGAEANRATAGAQECKEKQESPRGEENSSAPEPVPAGGEGPCVEAPPAQDDAGTPLLPSPEGELESAPADAETGGAATTAPSEPEPLVAALEPAAGAVGKAPSTGDAAPKEAGGESRPADAGAEMRGGSVTVSTDAWLALRHERSQRERQIKALQAQVASGQKELQKLDEVRAKLREQRAVALQVRQQGMEFQEGARLAVEEMRAIHRDLLEARSCLGLPEPTPEGAQEDEGPAEPVRSPTATEGEETAGGGCTDSETPGTRSPDAKAEGGGLETLEWRMLLSERETTARELASTLQKVEEMEKEVEDRKIELQIAERRRERERRSLLTALRELGASFRGEGSPTTGLDAVDLAAEEVDTSDGWMSSHRGGSWQSSGSSPSFLAPHPQDSGSGPKDEDMDRHHLLRISECEETVSRLREEIDAVQSRIAMLNQQAVTRQQALRFASTLPSAGALTDWGLARRAGRADLDALADLLGRLFVENFALRRRGRGGGLAGSNGQSEPAQAPPSTPPLDLSRFVVGEGDGDADSDAEERPMRARPAQVTPGAPSSQRPEPVAPVVPPQRSSPPGSPRTRLFGGLDFKALSVAE